MRRLAHEVLRRVAFWSSLAVLGATGLGYLYAYDASRGRALSQMQAFAENQGRHEEQAFRDAQAHLDHFRAEFLRRYQDTAVDYGARFDALYAADADGALRLDPAWYRGHRTADGRYAVHTTGFVGTKRPPLDADFRRRLVIATELVAELGPAWGEPFANLHLSMPENAMVLYWPGTPWGRQARADLDITAGKVVAATLQANNPERAPVWSGLYFDLTAKQWTVTYQLPVDGADGRHLVNPSHDILLDELLARLERSRLPGAQVMLLSRDGHLIAGPHEMAERDRERGVLHVDELDDPLPARVHRLASEHMAQGHPLHVMHDAQSGAYLAFTRIDGPDWRLVTLFPEDEIAAVAHKAAMMMLVLGLALQLILLVTVGSVFDRRVSQPIRRLQDAADGLARGEAPAEAGAGLPADQDNEIGSLVRSFQALAAKVEQRQHELEDTVAVRTRALAEANEQLEQLSRTDSLTALPNRRAFDADLAQVVASQEPLKAMALGMLDVDAFKAYNDTLGHEAGDHALRQVAAVLAGQMRRDVRCYRYGGEEFAVLFTAIAVPHAERILRRILEDVAALALPHPASPHGVVTVSAGLAKRYGAGEDAATLIRAADRQLYAAKASGRNRLVVG